MSYQPNSLAGGSPVSALVSYTEFATDITVSNTTEGTADTIVTAPAFTANGTDPYWIEFFCEAVNPGSTTGGGLVFVVYDGAAALAPSRIAQVLTPAASTLIVPVLGKRRLVPSNASHTYSIRCWRVSINGQVLGSNSATGLPGYILITKGP